ncbi:MAG: hypothetical protein U0228_19495 [Myxococcaceae bacterium]
MTASLGRVLLAVVVLLSSGCLVPRDTSTPDDRTCTRCHGDVSRDGDAVRKAAPPVDRFGNTEISFPGVGAHDIHLNGTATASAVRCETCHPVPAKVGDPGHDDGVTTLKSDTNPIASYDPGARKCFSSCHRGPSGVWTRPRPNSETCGTCHALPPPSPHPQAGSCGVCHAAVIATDGGIINPSLHVDGTTQVSQVECNACHGTAADTTGAPATGAHARHLAGGTNTRPVACNECHLVPATPATPTHPNGGPAELLSGVRWVKATQSCANNCHRSLSPQWTSAQALSCTGCHGAPPPAPHPPVTQCALCHPNATPDGGFVDRLQHVDGTVDVVVSSSCDGCHGSANNPAPPRDLLGRSDTSLRSVGAHQTHVVGRGLARVVACSECHVVPAMTVSPGHLDGVVQVAFSGVAISNLAQPRWNAQTLTCASAACHDIANFTSAPGGGDATTPVWNQVDGGQATCTSCHGMPPPLPHQQRSDCESCHLNATAGRTFVRPELHVNGHVDFALP